MRDSNSFNILKNKIKKIKNPYLKNIFFLTEVMQIISNKTIEEYGLEVVPFQKERKSKRKRKINSLKKKE